MSVIRTTAVASAVLSVAWATRQWWRSWGVDPAEAGMALAGDDLVPEPEAVDTRGITIAAPPEEVWRWLVQMGYGRAGWYSYDTIDMNRPSVDTIVPEWQDLALGDVIPTHPGGGFVVKVMDPGRALVLYNDTETLAGQEAAAAEHGSVETPENLRASGTFLATAAPEFAAGWAFVLREVPEGTRLIERFRVRLAGGPAPWLLQPLLGFGVFLMTRRQMLGIRARAERLGAARTIAPAAIGATG